MISTVHLHRALDRLYDTEEYRQHENRNGDPKGVPLRTLPPVVPPLRERAGFSLVENLLEDHEAFSPEVEILNLAIVCAEVR